jgi:hypothetical protein
MGKEFWNMPSIKSLHPVIVCLLALCALTACAPTTDAVLPAGVNRMIVLEEQLMSADAIRIVFHVTAEGIIQADLRGELLLAVNPGGATGTEIHLGGSGLLGGQAVDFLAQTEEGLLHFGPATQQLSMREPSALKAALLIGFTRMGILHNVARLVGGAPPDQAEGGVGEWVTLSSLLQDEQASTLMFDITVAGEPAGSATLTLDAEGKPQTRRQIVHFPGGEMRVTERYTEVQITGSQER